MLRGMNDNVVNWPEFLEDSEFCNRLLTAPHLSEIFVISCDLWFMLCDCEWSDLSELKSIHFWYLFCLKYLNFYTVFYEKPGSIVKTMHFWGETSTCIKVSDQCIISVHWVFYRFAGLWPFVLRNWVWGGEMWGCHNSLILLQCLLESNER